MLFFDYFRLILTCHDFFLSNLTHFNLRHWKIYYWKWKFCWEETMIWWEIQFIHSSQFRCQKMVYNGHTVHQHFVNADREIVPRILCNAQSSGFLAISAKCLSCFETTKKDATVKIIETMIVGGKLEHPCRISARCIKLRRKKSWQVKVNLK